MICIKLHKKFKNLQKPNIWTFEIIRLLKKLFKLFSKQFSALTEIDDTFLSTNILDALQQYSLVHATAV